MKLISLNIEGFKHLDLVQPFLKNELADTICLMEAPQSFQNWFVAEGYQCTFAPMCLKIHSGEPYPEGILVATKLAHTAEVIPYFKPTTDIVTYDHKRRRETQNHFVLYFETDGINIATTHFTWNPKGEIADEYQTLDMKEMLQALEKKPAHVLCGDLNIPRNINTLYDVLKNKYHDNIPYQYYSSLDNELHRKGKAQEFKKLFDSFMVDYLFTQEPYETTDTRLVFGVSDHAAIVSNVSKRK